MALIDADILAPIKRETDKLRQQLAASQAENAKLRKCADLYANRDNWSGYAVNHFVASRGYEPAQAALAKVEGVKDG